MTTLTEFLLARRSISSVKKAAGRGETASDVIRRALLAYVEDE